MSHTDDLLAVFDRRFSVDGDPWAFETSPYEIRKRAATVDACDPFRRRRSTLELGAANGVLATELGAFSDAIVAVEGAAAAAALADERLRDQPGATVVHGLVPQAVPPGPFDLVVASEILYYLDADAYAVTLDALSTWLAPGGRLVAVHWRPEGPERPRSADTLHDDLLARRDLIHVYDGRTDEYRLDVLERLW